MNAPGEVAQLGQGFLGVLVGGGDERQRPLLLVKVGAGLAGRQALLDLPEREGERGEPDLRSVVQIALDAAQPGGRLVDRAGPAFLQLAGALRRDGELRLRVSLRLQPSRPVLQGRVVGDPVSVGDGITKHPGRERDTAEQGGRGQDRRRRVRPVRRAPPRDRDRRQHEARDQAEHSRAPGCVRGQRVEQDRQRDVGSGGLERRHDVATVRLEAKENLQRRDPGRRGEGLDRVLPSRHQRGRQGEADQPDGRIAVDLARAGEEHESRQGEVCLPRVVPQPAPRAPHVISVRAGAGGRPAP